MTPEDLQGFRVLLLPGWLDSGPAHWQSRWEARHGDRRVVQSDWQWPRRGDWMARLDEVLLEDDARPALLVAHSLGCQLVAAWAAHSRHVGRVAGALLVAPPDTERADMPPQLHNWRPIARPRLPFASIAVTSLDDPYCAPARAAQMLADWGCAAVSVGARGHVNGDSGLGDWPEGRVLLGTLAGRTN
jgi:predicted alpha/beta hydrolase family esterase